MSSEANDEMNSNIEATGGRRVQPPRRNTGEHGSENVTTGLSIRAAHTRSMAGQKSKIPTNVGRVTRSGSVPYAQVEDTPRNSHVASTGDTTTTTTTTTVAAAAATTMAVVMSTRRTSASGPPISFGRFQASKSLTTGLSGSVTLKSSNTPSNRIGGSTIVKRSLENQFATKKKHYAKLKQELDAKQKDASDLYNEITELRDRMIKSGNKDPGRIDTINLTGSLVREAPYAFPQTEKHRSTSEGGIRASPDEPAARLDAEIPAKMRDLPKACLEMCTKMLRERSMFLESLAAFDNSPNPAVGPTGTTGTDIKLKIDQLVETVKNECNLVRSRLEEAKNLDEIAIEITEKWRSLWKELELSREKIGQLQALKDEAIKKMSEQLEAALAEGASVRAECDRSRESERTLQTELQKMHAKVRGLEAKMQTEITRGKEMLGASLDERLAEYVERIKILQRQKREIIAAIDPAFLACAKDLETDDENESHDRTVVKLTRTVHELGLNSKVASERNRELVERLAEIDALRSSVDELTRHNERLEIALNQKQLEIEEQDRVIRERCSATKARDVRIDPEGTKVLDQREARNHQAEARSAEKTDNVEELRRVLAEKQVQITRLERLVEQMEIQQERAQEQRTRLERKIAQFQLAMHYKKAQGRRGWLSIL